jgi:hypothetical protein
VDLKIILKIDPEETERTGVDCINLVQDRGQLWGVVSQYAGDFLTS